MAEELPYRILGLRHGASSGDVKQAWRRLCFKWHPDKCAHPKAAEIFAKINNAYRQIISPGNELKNEYYQLIVVPIFETVM